MRWWRCAPRASGRRSSPSRFEAANNSAILARTQYRSGLTDFQQLLEAERSLLSARDGVVSSRAAESLALVQLYRALGGGWNAEAAPEIGRNS